VVTIDSFQIPYYVEGNGIPCIVINDAIAMRRAFSKELRQHFKFIFMNPRMNVPYDKSFDIKKITLDTLLDDIELVRKTVDIAKVCIFGHSINGLTAFEYARKYPEHVTHVIMNGSPPVVGDRASKIADEYWESKASDERKAVLKQNWEKRKAEIAKMTPDMAMMQTYITDGPIYWHEPKYDCSWMFAGEKWNAEVWNHLFDVIMANYDITSRGQVQRPIFISLGSSDYAVPYILWDGVKEKLPNLSYNLFEKSGHWAFLEEQELFDKRLLEWVKSKAK
jgi:proline iminopeptidase